MSTITIKFIKSFLIIFLGVGFTLAGDIFLKKSVVEGNWFLVFGIFLYICGIIPVAIAFRMIDFGSVFLIWEALTVLLALIFATLYFKESFTFYKGIALIFAVLSLYFSYK